MDYTSSILYDGVQKTRTCFPEENDVRVLSAPRSGGNEELLCVVPESSLIQFILFKHTYLEPQNHQLLWSILV